RGGESLGGAQGEQGREGDNRTRLPVQPRARPYVPPRGPGEEVLEGLGALRGAREGSVDVVVAQDRPTDRHPLLMALVITEVVAHVRIPPTMAQCESTTSWAS